MSILPESESVLSLPQLVLKKKKGFGIHSNAPNPGVRGSMAASHSNSQGAYMKSLQLPHINQPGQYNIGKENVSKVGARQMSFEVASMKPKVSRQLISGAKAIVADCSSRLEDLYAGNLGSGETKSSVKQKLFALGGGISTSK